MVKKVLHKLIAGILRWQTKRMLKDKPIKIVAITGSVGKTTTKDAVVRVLSTSYRVLAHAGNYNTDIGIPMAVFRLETVGSILNVIGWIKLILKVEKRLKEPFPYDILVLEMGASHNGDIAYFMKFIKPDLGVITAVRPAHLEGFGSMGNILNEKFKLALGSKQVLLNAEDERLMSRAAELKTKPFMSYGLHKGDFRFEVKHFDIEHGYEGTLILQQERLEDVRVRMIAAHNLHSAIAAAAVGKLFGVGTDKIREALARVVPSAGRMNLLPGANGSYLIDDSYNANPEAVIAALDTLYALSGRKIAILGSMNELGQYSTKFHMDVGKHANKLDLLVTIGENAEKYLARAALDAGLASEKIKGFMSPYEAGNYVKSLLGPGDKVLVKGSQNKVFSEEAAAQLLANPADKAKLVRQSSFWQDIKRQAFSLEKL